MTAAEHLGIRLLAPDRPGIGLSSFQSFSIREYPRLIGRFADALGLERFAVTGLSGGGRYASAWAWGLRNGLTWTPPPGDEDGEVSAQMILELAAGRGSEDAIATFTDWIRDKTAP